jgi:hypothetical protein
MKKSQQERIKKYISIILYIFIFTWSGSKLHSQSVGNGSIIARFGVDGDLTADTSLNGGASSGTGKPADDWFKNLNRPGLTGIGVIDTFGAYSYKYKMQLSKASRTSLVFSSGMSVPKLTRSGGYMLLDALYAKDFADFDNSIIDAAGGTKVLDDPNSWAFSTGSVNSKDDILEFYSHVRRKGLTVNDSLFFYFGVGIYGNSGAKNVTSELFVNDVKYDTVAKKLTNLGSQGGRVAWRFDPSGNVLVIGDMIIAMEYNGSFSIHPRIWINKSTYDSFKNATPLFLHPANFLLGPFHAQTAGANSYGYADVEPLAGISTLVAQGSVSGASLSAAAPWGTISSASGFPYSATYDADQFVELSINLTALGVDPSLFVAIDPCTIPYRTIMFYSTASNAANSNPKDFAGPYPFWRYPRVISQIKGMDTLRCNNTTGSIFADSAYSLAWYKWTTNSGGNITGYNADSTVITYNKPGNYVLETAPLRGCFTRKDTVTILGDFMYPIASAKAYDSLVLGAVKAVNLYGGDSAASVNAVFSPDFGPSKGVTWFWTGKGGYTSTLRNPVATDSGDYVLVVTEKRNGCSSSARTTLVTLPVVWGAMSCQSQEKGSLVRWTTFQEFNANWFSIQKAEKNGFKVIGRVKAYGKSTIPIEYSFFDATTSDAVRTYRIVMENMDGTKESSGSCTTHGSSVSTTNWRVFPNPAESTLYLECNKNQQIEGWQIWNVSGKSVVKSEDVSGFRAEINIQNLKPGMYYMGVFINDEWQTQKFIKE